MIFVYFFHTIQGVKINAFFFACIDNFILLFFEMKIEIFKLILYDQLIDVYVIYVKFYLIN